MQRGDLVLFDDIELLDLDPAFVSIGQIVQRGSAVPPNGADDIPSSFQKFRGHGSPEAARSADEQNAGLRFIAN
ncbi:hypothetical protein GCM10027287_16040 [Bordetella muralis]